MSNISQLHPTKRVTITAHRVAFDLVPRDVLEQVFHAAIAVAWAADEEAYVAEDCEANERLESLQKAVSAASQYTVPVEHEVDEPITPSRP
ncbi:hypothetical protein [Delftia deserti]|uniref:DUF982 domain-containing protein n=1 Tax=Delftia deserti TaxID=1651218 RepID=A0ABW5EVK6_9BURK